MFICNFSDSFKNTTVTTSYSLGRYPKTYLDTILKGSNDINWGNIGDFNANIEHVSVYYNNFGGRHPE